MTNLVSVLYRELHYQMMKRNPNISERRLYKTMKKFSVKRRVAINSIAFVIVGAFFIPAMVTGSKIVISSISVALASFAFIYSFYVTAVDSSYVISMGIFDPLKFLPIRVGAYYLSGVLMLDVIPAFVITLPAIIYMLTKAPLLGLMMLGWVCIGTLIGHTLGLIVFTVFGLGVSYRKTRTEFLRSILRIVGVLIFIGAFYVVGSIQNYVTKYGSELSSVFSKYYIAFPFSAASIFHPIQCVGLMAFYSAVFGFVYVKSVNKSWQRILEPKVYATEAKVSEFKAGFGGQMFSLIEKDARLIMRKTSMAAGFLIPIYIVLPQVFLAVTTGKFPLVEAIILVAVLSIFSVVNADIILRVEGKEVDFLKTLPITKSKFVTAKAIMTSIVSILSALAVSIIAVYYNPPSAPLLPLAVVMPLNASLLTMAILFHYPGEEIGVPERGPGMLILLFIVVSALIGATVLPVIIWRTWSISYVISFVSLPILLIAVRKV